MSTWPLHIAARTSIEQSRPHHVSKESRRKNAVAILKASHADKIALDEEIRVLRGELARKLKLQNAQLRTMLERFERSNCRDATR